MLKWNYNAGLTAVGATKTGTAAASRHNKYMNYYQQQLKEKRKQAVIENIKVGLVVLIFFVLMFWTGL